MREKRRIYIMVTAVLVFLFIIACIYTKVILSSKAKVENNMVIYSANGINIERFNTKVGIIEVKGKDENIVQSYLEDILDSDYNNIGLKVKYEKVPKVKELNNIVEKCKLKTVEKPLLEDYSKVYTVIENSNNAEYNYKIINDLLGTPSNMGIKSVEEIKAETAKTTIEGQALEELNNSLVDIKGFYLKTYNIY